MQFMKVVCALDTADVNAAKAIVKKLSPFVGAFKIGHALTLTNGLSVIDELRDAGANRIFLDLKFHDIPNSVALAVREATRRGVWMMTLHAVGGPAMMTAAVEEARAFGVENAPLLMSVCVLTSLDQDILTNDIGVNRSISEQTVALAKLTMECGMDGVICPAPEIKRVRDAIGHEGVIVTPGIRMDGGDVHDQRQVGTAQQALADGASYLVIGRALIDNPDPEKALSALGFAIANR